jgi:hypothetical protein
MGYIGYTPAEQDRRDALGLPHATGADEPRHDHPGTQPEARPAT